MKIPNKKIIMLIILIILIMVVASVLKYFVGGDALRLPATKDFKNGNFLQACSDGLLGKSCTGPEFEFGRYSGGGDFHFYDDTNSQIGIWSWQLVGSPSACYIYELQGKLADDQKYKRLNSCSEFFNALEQYDKECNGCVKVSADVVGYEYYNLHISRSFILWLYHIGLPQKIGI